MIVKLVRDLIGEVDWPSHPELKSCLRWVNSREEHVQLLKKKFYEELFELLEEAKTQEEILEEMADVLEVLRAWAALHGIGPHKIAEERWRKHHRVGGFSLGTVLDMGLDNRNKEVSNNNDG